MDYGIVVEGYAVFRVDGVAPVVQVQVAHGDVIAAGRLLVQLLARNHRREGHYLGYFLIVTEVDLHLLALSSLGSLKHCYDNV